MNSGPIPAPSNLRANATGTSRPDGAHYPNIFAMELWSEVDLVSNSHKRRDDKTMIKWHQMTANDIKRETQGEYLVATHVCGDIGNVMGWKALTIEPKELDHVCGDAYRSANVPIVNQMQKHQSQIQKIPKPALITEYGGTSSGSEISLATGDVHGGIWAALFTRHAGTPLLWWHDFIHIRNLYAHYTGFARFLNGMDLRTGSLIYGTFPVESEPPGLPAQPVLFMTRALFHSQKQTVMIPEIGLRGFSSIRTGHSSADGSTTHRSCSVIGPIRARCRCRAGSGPGSGPCGAGGLSAAVL